MRLAFALGLMALVAGCGPARLARDIVTGDQGLGTPQPFFRSERNETLLQTPFLRGALIVAPIDWSEGPEAERFREAIAAELRRADIAALLEPPRAGGVAHSLATRREGDSVVFELYDPAGAVVGDFRADDVLSRPNLDWADFGAAAGGRTVRLIEDLEGGPPPERPRITVAVTTMSGAPADGDDALPRALRAILAQGGPIIGYEVLPATATIPDDAFRIEGVSTVAPGEDGQVRVRLSWRLVAPDGEVLGAVTQQNLIDDGAFETGWGPAAFDVALGAAEGLGALLDRARSSMESPPTE